MANVNIVKCANCNIVINELLTFVRHVMDYTDEESIHQLCTTTFSEEDITKAKCLLFESVPNSKKMPLRRKQGKKRMSRDLDDIIGLMKSVDPSKIPIFCARNLDLIPPVTYDHVDATRFIKELLAVKNRLNILEEKAVSADDFNLLKQELSNIKHSSLADDNYFKVNNKRGACLQSSFYTDSGPIGFNYVPEYYSIITQKSAVVEGNERPSSSLKNNQTVLNISVSPNCIQETETQKSAVAGGNERPSTSVIDNITVFNNTISSDCIQETVTDVVTHVEADTEVSNVAKRTGSPGDSSAGGTAARAQLKEAKGSALADADACASSYSGDTTGYVRSSPPKITVQSRFVKCKQVKVSSEWDVALNKSAKRYKLIGQKGRAPVAPNGNFKAADTKIPLLISNVSKETSEDDIVKYIDIKTNENVSLKKLNMRKTKRYDAYKLYVSKQKLDIFLNDEFWPNGITFRRFVHIMYKTKAKLVNNS
ncbi:uncharacterized protein LOC132904139 [Amyelois transitella]|uniref:uncharacterized protein LOC132904139 n=1 Tax=Amyelois transitella TaxID=680683 RepID=UPI00298FA491|nr:uncharacterized protein LOC132904139 [Amyelois transitella]